MHVKVIDEGHWQQIVNAASMTQFPDGHEPITFTKQLAQSILDAQDHPTGYLLNDLAETPGSRNSTRDRRTPYHSHSCSPRPRYNRTSSKTSPPRPRNPPNPGGTSRYE